MQKIVPHLWYDTQAKEAAVFYTSLFSGAKVKNEVIIHNTPSGNAHLITIDVIGQEFMLISAGPYFTFTPAISFLIMCEKKEEVDIL